VPVVDSRSPERFRGEVEPIDAVAGHVPGAVNLPFAEHFDEAGRLRPAEQIADRFASIGVGSFADQPIVYCGSGVTACVNLLAAEHAGLGTGRLYVGSWSGWSTSEGLPVATGDG
jgi:thiosulfate/3-mercaptopyruvate sulfurtransferase